MVNEKDMTIEGKIGEKELNRSTNVENSLQIHPFYAKQTQFQKRQKNINAFLVMRYENLDILMGQKTKPKQTQLKPIQTQFNPIQSQLKPKQTQFKPNQTQFLQSQTGQIPEQLIPLIWSNNIYSPSENLSGQYLHIMDSVLILLVGGNTSQLFLKGELFFRKKRHLAHYFWGEALL